MKQILIQALSLFFIILLGFILKKLGILSKKHGDVLSKIIVYITLPAAIIVNLASLEIKNQMLLFILIAVIWSIMQVILAYLSTARLTHISRSSMMYMGSGFNVGNFLLPFIQSIQPTLVPMISMFDIGNSIMLTGGTQATVDNLLTTNQRFSFRLTLFQLLRSVPFMCYLIMFCLRYYHVTLPEFIHTIFTPIANANVFLSMFMIGLYLDFELPKGSFRYLCQLFFLRFGMGLVLIFILNFLPIQRTSKLVLSLLCVSPIPLFGVMNAVISGEKEELVGFASSLSFILSLVLMTVIVIVMN